AATAKRRRSRKRSSQPPPRRPPFLLRKRPPNNRRLKPRKAIRKKSRLASNGRHRSKATELPWPFSFIRFSHLSAIFSSSSPHPQFGDRCHANHRSAGPGRHRRLGRQRRRLESGGVRAGGAQARRRAVDSP